MLSSFNIILSLRYLLYYSEIFFGIDNFLLENIFFYEIGSICNQKNHCAKYAINTDFLRAVYWRIRTESMIRFSEKTGITVCFTQ